MDTRERALQELKWIAFMAQQLGWHSLADRIARDALASKAQSQQLTIAHLQVEYIPVFSACQHAPAQLCAVCGSSKNRSFETDDDAESSFDRLNDLEQSWRNVSSDVALLHETFTDESWTTITGEEDQSGTKKTN